MSASDTPLTGDRVPSKNDAGIPAAYWSDLWEYHLGVAGEGEHAYNWSDKPHRLVYDLTQKVAFERKRLARSNALLREAMHKRTDAHGFMRWFSFWTASVDAHLKECDGR